MGDGPELVYFAPSDFQVARVDRQCIVYFCAAAARQGADVTLSAIKIRARSDEPAAENPLDLYRLNTPIRTSFRRVPVGQESSTAWISLNRLVVHSVDALAALRRRRRLILYTKTTSSALLLLLLRRLRPCAIILFEAHVRPRSVLQRFVLSRTDGVVANSHALAGDLVADGVLPAERVRGMHQGVDLAQWEKLRVSREEARADLGIDAEARLVVYTGKVIDGYREIDLIMDAARRLADRPDVRFLLVGGRADHVARLRERASRTGFSNVEFTGFILPRDVHLYQLAADVLLLYYPGGMELNEYRSPGKLFEYMAADRPIACVDLPVLREVLGNPPAAAMVPPDDPEGLAVAVARLLDDPPRGQEISAQALERVAAFTWDVRARKILTFASERAAERADAR